MNKMHIKFFENITGCKDDLNDNRKIGLLSKLTSVCSLTFRWMRHPHTFGTQYSDRGSYTTIVLPFFVYIKLTTFQVKIREYIEIQHY